MRPINLWQHKSDRSTHHNLSRKEAYSEKKPQTNVSTGSRRLVRNQTTRSMSTCTWSGHVVRVTIGPVRNPVCAITRFALHITADLNMSPTVSARVGMERLGTRASTGRFESALAQCMPRRAIPHRAHGRRFTPCSDSRRIEVQTGATLSEKDVSHLCDYSREHQQRPKWCALAIGMLLRFEAFRTHRSDCSITHAA